MTVLQFLLPTLLGAVVLLIILAMQSLGYRESMQAVSSGLGDEAFATTDTRYGFPTVARVQTRGPHTKYQHVESVEIYWENVIKTVLAAWFVAMPIGRWITGYRRSDGEFVGPLNTGWRNPGMILLLIAVFCIALGGPGAWAAGKLGADEVPVTERWSGLTLTMLLVATPITLITMTVRRLRWRRALLRRGFAVEMVS